MPRSSAPTAPRACPIEAPFDAILVSAGGPKVPEALKQQFAIGGRLVIPVGRDVQQTLLRVRRTGEDKFEEEDHGAVAFVPLIGAEGWVEPERRREDRDRCRKLRLRRWAAACRRSARHSASAPMLSQPHRRGGRAVRRSRRAGASCRALRRKPRGAARRSDPRHRRILRCARRHHRAAGREATASISWRSRPTGPMPRSMTPLCAACRSHRVPQGAFTRFPTWMWRNGEVAAFLNRLKAINADDRRP